MKKNPSSMHARSGPLRGAAILLALLFLLSLACRAQTGLVGRPSPQAARSTAAAHGTVTTLTAPTPTPAAASPIAPSLPQPSGREVNGTPPASSDCAFSPVTAQILEGTGPEAWLDWIEKLSGAEPVTINGEEVTITSRYSPAMFSDRPNARAFEYVLETVEAWYPAEQIEVMPFTVRNEEQTFTWNNLSVTLPGVERPDEFVILSAHLDSTANENPAAAAPGASDNGSGSAALLEAARLFREHRFRRTIQIIWFTGEEQGLLGSRAFVSELADPQKVVGVVNLDMFGYDSDSDACFEIHVGVLPASDAVGQCFVRSIDAYGLELERFDYLTDGAIDRSDHGSFWEGGIGAIEILENLFDHDLPQGCPNGDPNSAYHTSGDTVDRLNPQTGAEIVRAALAAVAGLAEPVEQEGSR